MNSPGSGSGFSGFGDFLHRRHRTSAFRDTHRVGQLVRGRILRQEAPGRAWVFINGHELLADINAEHALGRELTFRIARLTPHIVLQEISRESSGGSPLADAVHLFWGLRSKLEALLAAHSASKHPPAPDSTPDAREARARFFRSLDHSAEAALAYLHLAAMQARINELLAQRGEHRFFYTPWLVPGARDTEMLVSRGEDKTWLILGFSLPMAGSVQVRLMHKKDLAGYRLYLEDTARSQTVRTALEGLDFGDLGIQPNLLGVAPLPLESRRGILSSLLYAPDTFESVFHTRI
jgi:hypothetical protein